jgi:adenosine deaminase
LARLARNSIDASFASADRKRELTEELDTMDREQGAN